MAGSRLDHAEAALATGATGRAAALLDEALAAGEQPAASLWGRLAAALLAAQGPAAAEACARRGLDRHADDADLWQVLGVALRRLRRLDEAVDALERARQLDLYGAAPLHNLANVHNDRGDGAAAEAIIRLLLPREWANPQLRHMLGRALRAQGDFEGADAALAEAIELDPSFLEAWRDRAMLASEQQRHDGALAILAEALARFPGDPRLIQRQAETLIRAGRPAEARAGLEAVIAEAPEAAWAHHQLARLLVDSDLAAALAHAERATELAPRDGAYALTRAHACYRAAAGGRPGLLQTAADIVEAVVAGGPPPVDQAFVVRAVLAQVAAVDRLEAMGDFAALGRYWAQNGQHAALFSQLPLADTPERRRELLTQHRLWAGPVERRAGRNPVVHPARSGRRSRLRIGFLSSDLRRHAVGHFAQALFDHYDRDRYELYAYSFQPYPADEVQARIAGQVAAFRAHPGIAEHDAAQMIADDSLDMLIDLGATTRWNYAQILAYRPAPLQASWLGYPHSVGLAAIDHLILDPYVAPTAPDLLAESALLMPKTWVALGRGAFGDDPPVEAQPPSARNGFVTFGTANSPHKFTPSAMKAWARVLAAVPGSRFLVLRPEAAAPALRANVERIFAQAGIDPSRLDFEPVVGGHLAHYGRMDISLDTFPLTGGTTTCESLWMGVPVVSLRGEAVFQRLSHSLLTNAGLADLSVETEDDFVSTAVRLAHDAPRLAELRRTLRPSLRASPLGDTETFTRDFFDLMARTIEAR